MREGTRLGVGLALLAGDGLGQLVKRFGTPEPGSPREVPSASSGAMAPDPLRTPIETLAALRTIAVGVVFETQRVTLAVVDRLASGVAPITELVRSTPPVATVSHSLEARLAGVYSRGALEEARSRTYAAHALLGVTETGTDFIVEHLDVDGIRKRLDINDIVQSLALDELILQSTGGMAGEAIDAVRAQAVGFDSIVDRITTKWLRRPVRPGPGVVEPDVDGGDTERAES